MIIAMLIKNICAECKKHPGLRPSHIRDFWYETPFLLIIKKSFFWLHIIYCPDQHPMDQVLIFIHFTKLQQCDNKLWAWMNIHGIQWIIIILRYSIFGEKHIDIVFKTFFQVIWKLHISWIINIIRNSFKIITSMEIIYPLMKR